LTGVQKYGFDDARCVLERASARETAIRVAAGGLCKQYLRALGVEVCGFVKEICGVKDGGKYAFDEVLRAKQNELGMLDEELLEQAKAKIDELKKKGDTAGGVVEIRVCGLKSGFGSYATYGEKLDARIARGLMSIQAVKGVEFGEGFAVAGKSGKEVHDEIFYEEGVGYYRKTNRAGGFEGGMSNGEELIIRLAMKPIPTLMQGLQTVDIVTKEPCIAASERSDVCAIFAMQMIAEAVVAETIAAAVSERLGGDTVQEVKERYIRL
jgi:chorismate synthase